MPCGGSGARASSFRPCDCCCPAAMPAASAASGRCCRPGSCAIVPLPSKLCADARRGRPGCTRIPCSFRRRSVAVPSWSLVLPAGIDHFRQALVEQFGLLEERHLFAAQLGERRRRGLEALGHAAELARRQRGLHLFDPRQRRRAPSRVSASRRAGCPCANVLRRRERRVQFAQPGVDVVQRRWAARRRSRAGSRICSANGGKNVLKLPISSPSCLLVDVQRRGDFADARDRASRGRAVRCRRSPG